MTVGDTYTLTQVASCAGVGWAIGPLYVDWVKITATIDTGPTTPSLVINNEPVLISAEELDAGDLLSMESVLTPVLAESIGVALNPITAISAVTIQYREGAEPSGNGITGILEAILPLMMIMMMMGMMMPMFKGLGAGK